ncbi:MAG: SCO family protein [Firmicutes bacterium]|nr:SCO family protein [Alicyclobacillaceae bacterium]MCL6496496.1 SCO family protein [Bacillota bacterium]
MKPRTARTVGWVAVGAVLAALGVRTALAHSPSRQLPPEAAAALAADGMTPLGGSPAPDFHLVDQRGRPVALDQFRGKTVILTFLDPVCWWDCPLQAAEMAGVDRLLGPAKDRVVLLAVAGNPTVHSLGAIAAFDRSHHLTGLPNWIFATGSTTALQAVWKAYGYQVRPALNGMDPHSDLFYLIGPDGHLDYLSNPEANAGLVTGTSALLAAYAARVGHWAPPPQADLPALSLGPVATAPPLGGVGPVAWLGPGPQTAWAIGNVSANGVTYQVAFYTRDGGRHWRDVGPPGLSKRGGTVLVAASGTAAWAVVRPFGYQLDPAVFATADGGRNWAGPTLLPGPLAPGNPLAAAGATVAWVASGQHLWQTEDGGQRWTARGLLPGPAGQPVDLAFSGGQLWLAIGSRLWRWTPGHWANVALPSAPGSGPVTVGTPWPVRGGWATPVIRGGARPRLQIAMEKAGTWQWSRALDLPAPDLALVSFADGSVFAVGAAGLHLEVWRWNGSPSGWVPVSGPWPGRGQPTALTASGSRFWLTVADGSRQAWVWNGRAWIQAAVP